jgi:hypothetical protein
MKTLSKYYLNQLHIMIIIPTNNLIFALLKVKNDVFLNIEKTLIIFIEKNNIF